MRIQRRSVLCPAFLSPDAKVRAVRFLDGVLHLHDTPTRTAAAFALGVFFSFSPFIGFQILASMTVAVALRLNRAAVFVGLNANLPWFIVPWYAATTLGAAAILGEISPADAAAGARAFFSAEWSRATLFDHAGGLLRPILLPLLIGSTTGAAVVAVVAFGLARVVLVRRAVRTAA